LTQLDLVGLRGLCCLEAWLSNFHEITRKCEE
jgi:hypothetical protein